MDYFVNYFQSPELRRAKYALVRKCGVTVAWATAMRDWRRSTLLEWLEVSNVQVDVALLNEMMNKEGR